MDGIDPEYSGDLDTANAPTNDRRAGQARMRPRSHISRNGESEAHPCPSLSSPFPVADWKLFANFQLEGDNAACSLVDGTGRIIDDASGNASLWGASGKELKGQSIIDLISDPSEGLVEWLLNLAPESTNEAFEVTVSRSNFHDQAVRMKRLPLFISSDPRQTRIVLKAVPIKNSATLPTQPGALNSGHDLEGNFLRVNSSWSSSLGYEENELIGLSLSELVHPADQATLEQLLLKLNAIGGPCRELLRIRSKNGNQRSLLLRGERSFDGQSLRIAAKDVSLDSSAPAQGLLGIGIELVNECVLLLSKEGPGYFIRFANRAFEESTGYRSSEIVGKSISDIESQSSDSTRARDIENTLQAGESLQTELLLGSASGAPVATRAQFLPLRDELGQTRFYAAVLEDLTKEKAVASELEAKNQELSQALETLEETQKAVIQQENLRALGQMASGIAHDFNNLLAPILGFSELLLNMPADARDNEKLESFLKKIQIAAQDGAAVVSRLREFYRAHNREESEDTLIEPAALLDQVKDLTKHRWKTQSEARGIDIRFETDIQSTRFIRGNEPELRQSLANIVINAVDAIEDDGAISVIVDDWRDRLRIRIKDTGNGMPRHIQEKCLDPFYTTKGQLGTGLGLSIVCGIVKRHGGEFAIESDEGKGTTIEMKFPAVEAPDAPILEDEREESCPSSLRIMLVDDEDVLLEVISELLATSGHVVDTFSSPETALDAFDSSDYDLVITDRAMPRMSGDQLAETIKSQRPDTPVYLMTGFGDAIKDSGERLPNIDAVLGKPVPLDALNRKLADLASKKEA